MLSRGLPKVVTCGESTYERTITQKADQPMDTQVTYNYQRNSNEPDRNGWQRPGNPGNGDNTNGNDPRKGGTYPLRVFLIIVAMLALLAAGYLFLGGQASNMQGQPVGELPSSSFYQQVINTTSHNAPSHNQIIPVHFQILL